MSNLIATDQVRGGDWVRVEFDEEPRPCGSPGKPKGLPVQDMARLVDTSITIPQLTMAERERSRTRRVRRQQKRQARLEKKQKPVARSQ